MNLPNKLTVLRILLIPLFMMFFLLPAIPHNYLWALVVFGCAAITDALDGNIARKRGLVTSFGKLMDPLADKLLVMSALVCFIPVLLVPVVVVVIILAREFLVTSIRLVAASGGVVIAADGWGKAKTIAQMVWISTALLIQWLGSSFPLPSGLYVAFGWLNYAMIAIVVVLTVVSGLNYAYQNRHLYAEM